MRGDQIPIHFVERVAVAIVDKGIELVAVVRAHAPVDAPAVRAALVDVVAAVKDEIELLFRDAAERGEVAVFVVIAAAHCEPQSIDQGADGRRGSRPPDLADLVAGAEAVPVVMRRIEAGHLGVHAVTELRSRERRAASHDRREPGVACHLPVDFDIDHRHAAALERPGRQPRPQDDAVWARIAGRDAE